jgi:hypothetical protein
MPSGRLNIAVDHDDFYDTIRSMRKLPVAVKREVNKQGAHLAEPLAVEIRHVGLTQGSHAGRVADTVKATMKDGVPAVTAGGPPYTMGSEWGGQHRYRIVNAPVYGRMPLRPYMKHTTMQFRPHIGNEGYWFSPTLRSSRGLRAVLEAWRDVVDEVLASI